MSPTVVAGSSSNCPASNYAFVVVCGGPGIRNPKDPDHDKAWDNYVTTPGWRERQTKTLTPLPDECLYWFVCRPPYKARWDEDVKSNDSTIRGHVAGVREAGYSSYIDLLEKKAISYKRNLVWFDSATQFWALLRGISRKVSRVWYFGHASKVLLFLRYPAISGDDQVKIDSIDLNADIAANMAAGEVKRTHKFFGCNTDEFAQRWAKTFGVYAVGASRRIAFRSAGVVVLDQPDGQWVRYTPSGVVDSVLIDGADQNLG